MKYYLLLLISVFLSLGIGMMVGISLQSKDVLEKQQSIIAQRLEDEFIVMRSENRELRDSVALLEKSEADINDLCQTLFNTSIQNKLDGLRVALIETGEERDYSSLINLLKVSGASIESSITFRSEIFKDNKSIEDVIKTSVTTPIVNSELYDTLAGNLMDSLLLGEYTPLIEHLNQLNLIRSLIDLQAGCDAIILANYSQENNEENNIGKFNGHLVELAKEHSIPIIIVENENTEGMDLTKYKRMGISTIDHVNTLYGKLSLVSLLYGNKGNYGLKDGVEGLMPVDLFPEKVNYREEAIDFDHSINNQEGW